MFPAYGYDHPYPQSRPQTECRHHPISEGIPPQMKMEGSNPPFTYQPWPPHHFGYPVPTQCHSCCNHNNPYPSYYPYRPPYPHFPSPPQCYGAYPVYPEPYPFHYAPPPHYTMEIPKYEYDKNMPGNFHCCGCSHPKTVNTSGDKGVKIEEHEPEAEHQEDSIVPAGCKTRPKQPIMWVPPEYMKNQERVSGAKPRDQPNGWQPLDYETIKRILESVDGGRLQDQKNKRLIKSREKEDVGHQENVGQEPKSWSRLMPLDVDGLKKMLQPNENLRKDHDDQGKNQSHELPFPIIWLPYNNGENGQIGNKEGASCALESSAQKECEGDDHSQKMSPGVRKIEGDIEEKPSVEKSEKSLRTIPVKYLDETTDVKAIEDSKKSTEKVTKSKLSTSPVKATKLPPICLRVDPLPKKKNGQGKSRSPSPPGDEVKQVDSVKPSSVSENKAKGIENEPDKKSMEEPQPKTEKNDVVVEKPAKLAGDENEGKDVGERPKSKEVEVKKKILSGTEAATIIQSAYRGYEVRRWEPLKKMRQIASIEEEADALKRRIESGAGSMDLKQKVALGETIMSLLLKLDTIQGLHSSVRDVRKHVAKKLVSIQEMLDTIVLKQPENESSQTPENSEAEAKGGETQLQTLDESSLSSGLSAAEDQGVEETKDHISSSHEVSHVEESCSAPESLSGEMAHDQAIPEEETEINNLADMPEEAHELSQECEECPSVQTAVGISVDEASIKSVDQEPAPVVSEAHPDSTDETDMSHDLLAELPVAILEDSAIQDQHEPEPSEPSNGKVLQEDAGIDEPEKLQESDETSKVEIPIVQQDAESPENAETELEPKTVKNPTEQGTESVVPEENHVPEHEEVITKNHIENESDHEVDAKPCEEDVKLEKSSAEDNVKEENEKMRSLVEKLIASGKEQEQVICSLNEKLKELEGKLAKEKKRKGSRVRKARVLRPRSCGASAKGFSKQGQMSLAS